jgi:hypothetical protein
MAFPLLIMAGKRKSSTNIDGAAKKKTVETPDTGN